MMCVDIGYGNVQALTSWTRRLCIEPLLYNTIKEEISGIHNGNTRI